MPKYRDSARAVEDSRDEVIQSQVICIKEKDQALSSKEVEIQQLRQEVQERDQSYGQQLQKKER